MSLLKIADWILEKGTKYSPLLKAGTAALSTYASFKDQQKKNQMQQDAYDDYLAQAEAAGHAARAAIDINYTPMTVSGVPQTKADVTDFTAVAAHGGLMNLPTRQRKRYATQGFVEDDIEVMDIDVTEPTSSDLEKETGLDLSGEQVKYNTGNSRRDAWGVWNSGGIDQEIYEFDFEIFFESGDWMDRLKGQAPVQGDMQMASAPDPMDERNSMAQMLFGKNLEMLNQMELEQLEEAIRDSIATGGIAGLRHGGRPGYAFGPGPVVDQETMAESITLPDGGEEVVTDSMEEIKDQTAGPDWYHKRLEHLMFLGYSYEEAGEIAYDSDKYYEIVGDPYAKGGRIGYDAGGNYEAKIKELMDKGLTRELAEALVLSGISEDNYEVMDKAQGGRIKKDNGGIMNLGGLEKDYRTTGGFVPIGAYEKKDDVPARLSKNEFVMTADAVRAAGGGSINKGAQRMYDTMKHLEAQPQAQRMTA